MSWIFTPLSWGIVPAAWHVPVRRKRIHPVVLSIKQSRSESYIQSILTCPPPAQAATRAREPFSSRSLLAAVVTSRAPVAPNGWPMEREPPQLFSFSMGMAPNLGRCKYCCENQSEFMACRLAKIWPCSVGQISWLQAMSNHVRTKYLTYSKSFMVLKDINIFQSHSIFVQQSRSGICRARHYIIQYYMYMYDCQ